MRLLLALACVCVLSVVHATTSQKIELSLNNVDCTATSSSKDLRVRFDLSDLAKNVPVFVAEDADSFQDYKYAWALCKNLDKKDIPTIKGSPCFDKEGEFAALQLHDKIDGILDSGKCVRLGTVEEMKINVIESDGMVDGVSVTYTGGEDINEKVGRSFTVEYRCSQDDETKIGVVHEPSPGIYTTTVSSVHACPNTCISNLNKGELCSGHGICAIDTTAKAARCFCNKGFGGDICHRTVAEDTGDDDSSGATSALIGLNITLLVLIMGVSGFVMYKTKEMADGGEDAYARMDNDTVVPANNAMVASDEYMDGNDINYVGRVGARAAPMAEL